MHFVILASFRMKKGHNDHLIPEQTEPPNRIEIEKPDKTLKDREKNEAFNDELVDSYS